MGVGDTMLQDRMSPRKLALAAGIFYLLTFVSIPTLALYAAIHDPGYITGPGPDTPALIGAVLEIIVGLAGIATAVTLYPILKHQNQAMALGFVGSRVLEASTIFAGVAFLLAVVSLRQAGVGAEQLPSARALLTLYDRIFLVGQSLMPAINDLLLGLLFYQSRLLPRPFAVLGVVGAVLLVASDLAILFGVFGQHSALAGLAALPVAVFEFVLGIWLIVRGFNAAGVDRLYGRT